jgi:competence protein ComFC
LNWIPKPFLDLLYPRKCPLCRELSELAPCNLCRQNLVGQPIELLAPVAYVDEVRACFAYENGTAADCVKLLKYNRETVLNQYMAGRVSELYWDWNPIVDAIVPVPIHRTRLSLRGFNQAMLLCDYLPSHFISEQLMRIRRTTPQASLSAERRATNLTGAFRCPRSLVGQRVLLVDDVFTSGATASECAKAMKAAGAEWVGVLCFAARGG